MLVQCYVRKHTTFYSVYYGTYSVSMTSSLGACRFRYSREARFCEGHRGVWSGVAHRCLLFGARTPLTTQLHIQVQGDGGGGATTTLTARVPQRLAPRGRAQTVRLVTKQLILVIDHNVK